MDSDWIEVDNFNAPPQQPQYEGIPGWIARQLTRTGARALETAIGTPRAIVDIVGALKNQTPAGRIAAPIIQKGVDFGKMILPSSEGVKGALSKVLPEGYIEPQTGIEEVGDAIANATTGLLLGRTRMPGWTGLKESGKSALNFLNGLTKGTTGEALGAIGGALKEPAKTVGKAATAASVGQAGGFLAKKLGFGPLVQEGTNIGFTLLTSAGLDTNLKRVSNELYKIRDEALRPGEFINGDKVFHLAEDATDKFLKPSISTNRPGYQQVNEVATALNNAVTTNKFGSREIDLRKLINIKEQMWDYINDVPWEAKKAKHVLTGIDKEIKNILRDPKITGNQIFSEAQTAADSLYGHIKNAEKINDWARYMISSKPALGLGSVASMYGIATHAISTLGKAAAVGGVGTGIYGGAHGLVFLNTIMKDPTARKEYMKMMTAASKNSSGQFIKSAEKLNSILANDESTDDDWVEI